MGELPLMTPQGTFVINGAERVIVSEVPGTTRDSIDVRYEMDGKTFVAIDTPGFRRSKSVWNVFTAVRADATAPAIIQDSADTSALYVLMPMRV